MIMIPRRTSRGVRKSALLIERLVASGAEDRVGACDAAARVRDSASLGTTVVGRAWVRRGIGSTDCSLDLLSSGRLLTRCIMKLISGARIRISKRMICSTPTSFMRTSSLFGRLFSGIGDGIAHGRIGLHILHPIVVHDAEVSLAKGLGHGTGHLRFGFNDSRAHFLL